MNLHASNWCYKKKFIYLPSNIIYSPKCLPAHLWPGAGWVSLNVVNIASDSEQFWYKVIKKIKLFTADVLHNMSAADCKLVQIIINIPVIKHQSDRFHWDSHFFTVSIISLICKPLFDDEICNFNKNYHVLQLKVSFHLPLSSFSE